MKNLFTKEDKKNIIRWIISVILIYAMGFATTLELIIGVVGIFPIILLINAISLIINKASKKKTEKEIQ